MANTAADAYRETKEKIEEAHQNQLKELSGA